MSRVANLLNDTYSAIRNALDQREVSSHDLTRESLRRARLSQASLNSCISILEPEALAQALEADKRLDQGERGALLGIPIVLKDLILAQGTRTTAGSKMLENFVAPYDATVVSRLKSAGSPLVAKTNLDEFAMGSSNESSYFGVCRNPWDLSRVPGGSSGGSAVAVAARIAPLSLGTDTGGSIRQPSGFCGITGLKPTYGRVSRYGVVAYASSLDQVGPMSVDAESSAAILDCISGPCHHDATSSSAPLPDFLRECRAVAMQENLAGLRVGIPREYFEVEGLSAEVKRQIETVISGFKEQGAQIVEISLPHTKFSLPAYYLIATSEASSNLARYDGAHYGYRSSHFQGGTLEQFYACTRGEGFGDEVKLRIMLGTYSLSAGYFDAYYRKASQARALIRRDFEDAFKLCDVIASPTSPTSAFKIGEKIGDPLSMYLADVYTLATNLAGLPAISFNTGFDSKNLPIGMQLMSPWFEESRLLGLAARYQKQNPSSLKLSPVASEWAHEPTPGEGVPS